MEARDQQSTRVTFRMSYKAKEKLQRLARELKAQVDRGNVNISMLIRAAIENTWGVNCDEHGPRSND